MATYYYYSGSGTATPYTSTSTSTWSGSNQAYTVWYPSVKWTYTKEKEEKKEENHLPDELFEI